MRSYTGDWFDDLPHGTGEYQWRAGHKYFGDYQFGVPQGNGVFETSRGDIYQVRRSRFFHQCKGINVIQNKSS